MDETRYPSPPIGEQESEDQILREAEHSKMMHDLEAANEHGLFDPENPGRNQSMTPMEHLHIGSTMEGLGYYPNLPCILLGDTSLEAVNRVREEMNKEGGRPFYCKTNDGNLVQVLVEFLPLTEEQIRSSDPVETFKIVGAISIMGKEMPIPSNAEEYLTAKMSAAHAAARKKKA